MGSLLGSRWTDSNQYKVTGIPSMFLLDGQGVIRQAGLRGHTLGTAVAELVEENLTKSRWHVQDNT